jgi:hypothetical protein
MIKYGVLKEYKCECGQTVTVPEGTPVDNLEKVSQIVTVENHIHIWKPVEDEREKEG